LDWNNDDELSISLIAFNEAINSYKKESGKGFLSYAEMVIHHRLIDYFRQVLRSPPTCPLDYDLADSLRIDAREAWVRYREEVIVRERAEEIATYQRLLRDFGISMSDLVKICPKHRDTRLRLFKVAEALVANRELVSYFQRHKQLPQKELMRLTGLTQKVLDTGRKYIIAVVLILINEELYHLRSYIYLSEMGEKVWTR
jgi:RNA polymerase sigma factor